MRWMWTSELGQILLALLSCGAKYGRCLVPSANQADHRGVTIVTVSDTNIGLGGREITGDAFIAVTRY